MDEFWIAVLVSGVTGVCLVAINIFRSNLHIKKTKSELNDLISQSKKEVRDALTPYITFLPTIALVRKEAADIISRAAQSFKDARHRNSERFGMGDGKSSEDLTDFYITMYGSAYLGQNHDDLTSSSKDESITVYQEALRKASKDKVQFRRYVGLIPQSEISSRSEPIKQSYISWLKKQMSYLNSDPSYTLIISPRAPQWGTSNSTIITKDAILELKGNGSTGILIDDSRISNEMRGSLRDDIYDSAPSNRREINIIDDEQIKWLENEIKLIEDLCR